MSKHWSVEYSHAQGKIVVCLRDSLTIAHKPEDIVNDLVNKGGVYREMDVDCRQLTRIDHHGIGYLLEAFKQLKLNGCRMRLTHVPDKLYQHFRDAKAAQVGLEVCYIRREDLNGSQQKAS